MSCTYLPEFKRERTNFYCRNADKTEQREASADEYVQGMGDGVIRETEATGLPPLQPKKGPLLAASLGPLKTQVATPGLAPMSNGVSSLRAISPDSRTPTAKFYSDVKQACKSPWLKPEAPPCYGSAAYLLSR